MGLRSPGSQIGEVDLQELGRGKALVRQDGDRFGQPPCAVVPPAQGLPDDQALRVAGRSDEEIGEDGPRRRAGSGVGGTGGRWLRRTVGHHWLGGGDDLVVHERLRAEGVAAGQPGCLVVASECAVGGRLEGVWTVDRSAVVGEVLDGDPDPCVGSETRAGDSEAYGWRARHDEVQHGLLLPVCCPTGLCGELLQHISWVWRLLLSQLSDWHVRSAPPSAPARSSRKASPSNDRASQETRAKPPDMPIHRSWLLLRRWW